MLLAFRFFSVQRDISSFLDSDNVLILPVSTGDSGECPWHDPAAHNLWHHVTPKAQVSNPVVCSMKSLQHHRPSFPGFRKPRGRMLSPRVETAQLHRGTPKSWHLLLNQG